MMPVCCINCFHDIEIKKIIMSKNTLGRCSYCQSKQTPTCEASSLAEQFEFLTYVLDAAEGGGSAHELINSAFAIFSEKVQDTKQLLHDIVEESFDGQTFQLKLSKDHYTEGWSQLCNELKHTNRFFLKNELYNKIFNHSSEGQLSKLFMILEQLEQEIFPEDVFYRARINDEPLSADLMGAPPAKLSTAGRANPKGISYVYLADNIDTCISEVRPYKGSDIYVSEFRTKEKRRVIDLTNPRETFSIIPFSESEYDEVLAIIELLESFSLQLSLPVKPHLSELEYIPTQFLCEYFKSLGSYDGIVFNSSFGKGRNLVFFDSNGFDIGKPDSFKLCDINFNFEKNKHAEERM